MARAWADLLCAMLACNLASAAFLMVPISVAARQSGDPQKKLKNRSLHWSPPAVDSPIHTLASAPPCVLANVLGQAALSVNELITNLQNFTAQEKIEYQTTDRDAIVLDLGSATFDYVVDFEKSPGGLVLQEIRNPRRGSSLSAAATQDTGVPEIVLIFLPNMQADYEMSCDGAVERNHQLAWVIHFRQRKGKPSRTYSFRVNNIVYPVGLKGRAWVASDSGQVVHMETSLMEEVPAIGVHEAYLSIDYAPVQFQKRPVRIWLPQSVDGFCDFGNHRTIVSHTFSDFMLFSVQTDQKIEKPKQP
ncbi:MAG: hypothetical protein WA765_16075 [Candidatus Acidiferrum sp.]